MNPQIVWYLGTNIGNLQHAEVLNDYLNEDRWTIYIFLITHY